MQHLLGPTQTLVLAALLLVVIASLPSLPPLQGSWGRWRIPALASAMLATVILLGFALRHSPVLHESLPSRVIRYAAHELDLASERNVIVVDGGSYVLNGVDTEVLEASLRELGYDTRAIRFAAGAANHFERYYMQQSALRRSKRQADPKQKWVYLAEVQRDYDRQPLVQFERNQDSHRTYAYLTPENAWYAVDALTREDSEVPLDGAWRWPLLRHALVNATNTGAFQRLVPESDMRMHSGRVSDGGMRRFKFRGMDSVMAEASKRGPRPSAASWLTDVREPRTRRLWRPRLDELVYFGVPTTRPQQLKYIRAFCRATRITCLVPSSQELLHALDSRKAWRNATHLSKVGGHAYTRWLARELAATGTLQK